MTLNDSAEKLRVTEKPDSNQKLYKQTDSVTEKNSNEDKISDHCNVNFKWYKESLKGVPYAIEIKLSNQFRTLVVKVA